MKNRGLFLLSPYRKRITVIVVMGIAASLMGVAVPSVVGAVSDEIGRGIGRGIDFNAVLRLSVTALVLIMLSFVISLLQKKTAAGVSKDLLSGIRSMLNDKLDRIPVAYYDVHPEGDTLSRITNDVEQIGNSLLSGFTAVLTSLVTVSGCIVMMFVTNWMMALAVIILTAVGFCVNGIMIKKGGPLFVKQQSGLGMLNSYINETFNGHIVIRAFNAEDEVRENFERQNLSLYDSVWKAQFISQMMPAVIAMTGNLTYVLVCILGAFLMIVEKGGVSLSTIVVFIMYVRMFQSPVMVISQSAGMTMPAFAAADRVAELLEETETSQDTCDKKLDSIKGDVSFSHVSFGYLPDRPVIRDFSAEVKGGQKVAIVGPTGAGKTTIANLLMRFYELNGGSISIDGVSISDIPRENLHKLVGMVLQETWTFEGSVRDNIIYSTQDVSKERLDKVLSEAGLDRLTDMLPDGLDTVLSERTGISAGQKQLITIARAMIANPPILILDEATSNVDTRMERIIQSAIDRLTEGRTSFVIAHRLSTITNADVIFVMRDGDVAEIGKHNELLEKGGLYAELYRNQFD